MGDLDLAGLKAMLAEANLGTLTADTHHQRDYAGRSHGFLRTAGELVPVAGFVLAVEGMPQDMGVARLKIAAAAVNSLPALIQRIEALEEALEPFAAFAHTFIDAEGWNGPMRTTRIVDWFGPSDFRCARALFPPQPKAADHARAAEG